MKHKEIEDKIRKVKVEILDDTRQIFAAEN